MNILQRLVRSYKHSGALTTARKVFIHLSPRAFIERRNARNRRRQYREMLAVESAEERFRLIYEKDLWGAPVRIESRSGGGSTLSSTTTIRARLPALFEKYAINSVLDAPCGDFNWMQHVLPECPNVKYTGGDIVDALISRNQREFGSDQIDFKGMNITKDPFGKFDLIIVRDCLFHLSFSDTSAFLLNLSKSPIKYLLTTTHAERGFQNSDIVSGDFRLIDLFSPPYSFPEHPLERFDDSGEIGPRKEICLFRVSDVPATLLPGRR